MKKKIIGSKIKSTLDEGKVYLGGFGGSSVNVELSGKIIVAIKGRVSDRITSLQLGLVDE